MKDELKQLYEIVSDRKTNAVEGSYTTYLYEKGIEKILKKVGEESSEVIIAGMKDNKEELINELGDLFYHLCVLMAEKDVSLDDVYQELNNRSKKTGNLKAERKPIEKL